MATDRVDVIDDENLAPQLEYVHWGMLDWDEHWTYTEISSDNLRSYGLYLQEHVEGAAEVVAVLQDAGWLVTSGGFLFWWSHPTVVFRSDEEAATYVETLGLGHVEHLEWTGLSNARRAPVAPKSDGNDTDQSPWNLLERFRSRAKELEAQESEAREACRTKGSVGS